MIHKALLISLISQAGDNGKISLSEYKAVIERGFSMFTNRDGTRVRPTLEHIEYIIRVYFDAPLFYYKSSSRRADYKVPRFWFCYFARRYGYTLERIGLYCMKDHATVLHASKKVAQWITTYRHDKERRDDIAEQITVKIKPEVRYNYTIT